MSGDGGAEAGYGRLRRSVLSLCSCARVSSADESLMNEGVSPFRWMSYCHAFHLES
jgi:hypothetical protein